jgi:hypothetical protein
MVLVVVGLHLKKSRKKCELNILLRGMESDGDDLSTIIVSEFEEKSV